MLFKYLLFIALAVASVANAELDLSRNIVFGQAPENISTLVIGGNEAPKYAYQYTVGVRGSRSGTNFCGGTLISPYYVVTAAHCTAGGISYVSIGSHYNSGSSDGEQIAVARVTSHPSYSSWSLSNDIAILQLSSPSSMPTVALASSSFGADDAVGSVATLHGWGRTSYPGNASPVLKELNVRIVSSSECQSSTGNKSGKTIVNSMVCAGGISGQAACHGDSGGPLVIKTSGQNILVGAVSWGVPCGVGYPDVYARISNLRSFIDSQSEGHRWV